MNRADAAQILAILSAPHGFTIEPDTMQVWHQAALERCDAALATEIAVRLVETEERFPTPARFNAERQKVERERYLAEREQDRQQALPGVPTSADVRRHAIAKMRATLATLGQSGARGHWHGGPDPCPICGGINPAVLAAMSPEERTRCELRIETVKADQRARLGV